MRIVRRPSPIGRHAQSTASISTTASRVHDGYFGRALGAACVGAEVFPFQRPRRDALVRRLLGEVGLHATCKMRI
jgi:hypothetical protein